MNEDAGPPAVRRSCLLPSQLPPLCPVVGSTQHQDGASAPCTLPLPGPSPPHTPPWSPQDQSRASSQLLLPTPQVSRAFVGGVGREGAGVWNCGSGFWVRELSARQACEADLTLSSQSVAICSSDPVQPAVAREGRAGFLEAWFWLQVWAMLSRPAARRNWPCWPLPAPICASPPFTPCELGQESTPRELQQSQLQGLSRRRRGSWTGCWHSWPESGDNVGPQTCLEEAAPRRTASFGRCPSAPLSSACPGCCLGLWGPPGPWGGRRVQGGAYPSPQAPFEHGEDPAFGDSLWVLSSGPHLAVFQPLLPGPGGHPPLQQLTCPRAWAGLEQTLCSENPPARSSPACSSPVLDQCSEHPGLLPIPHPRI